MGVLFIILVVPVGVCRVLKQARHVVTSAGRRGRHSQPQCAFAEATALAHAVAAVARVMPPKKRRGSGWERRSSRKAAVFDQPPLLEEVRACLMDAT